MQDSATVSDLRPRAVPPLPMFLVEDDEHLAEALQLVLHRAGFQVTWCEDALQATARLTDGDLPVFIVLDLNTPNMDGWEFRLRQRQQPGWSQIPVIAVSADHSAKAAAIDACAFLPKPIDEHVLLDTIERVLADRTRAASRPAPPRARTIDLGNALSTLVESVGAARGHCRSLMGEVSGLVGARARAVSTLLKTAERAAQHMEDIVAHEAPHDLTLPEGVVDVGRVLQQSLLHAELNLPAPTEVVADLAPDVFALGDPGKLGRVLLNLLRNAGEAMVDVAEPMLHVEVRPAGAETVSITISDTGCGMPPETLERAYDPFYTTGRRQLSQGLGLSVARRLVQEMGGALDMLSCPEVGTTVRISLRRETPEAASGERTSRLREHVLVVDDDANMLLVLENVLSERFTVTAMRSWQALHHVYAGHAFDLVLYNNTRSETRALSFFAALTFKFPEQAARVVFLQNAHVEQRVRRWLDDVGIWQVEEALVEEGLARRLERLLRLWSSIGMRKPRDESRAASATQGVDVGVASGASSTATQVAPRPGSRPTKGSM